jgi:hypothetical protein
MPTLNGWLLGYPVIYCVCGYEDAAKASRLLSAGRLHLFTIRLPCTALRQLTGQHTAGNVSSTGRRLVVNTSLLAFSVPEELHTAEVDQAVALMMAAARAAVAGEAGSCTGAMPPTRVASIWGALPILSVETVGPGAFSL